MIKQPFDNTKMRTNSSINQEFFQSNKTISYRTYNDSEISGSIEGINRITAISEIRINSPHFFL
jgi:hypothetical protein